MKLVVTDMYGCKDSLIKNNYINVKTVTADFTVSDSVGICTPFKVSFSNTSLNALSQVWNFGDGGLSSTANPIYYYTEPGTYYAKLTAKRSAGCFNTDSVKIKVTAPRATLNYVASNICVPLQVSFHVSTRDSVSYVWDFNDGISFSSYDSFTTHTYLLPGNFIPSVILKDSNGCIIAVIGKDTIKTYSSKVNFTADDSLLCNSGAVNFIDSSSSGSIINTYNWSFGDGSFSTQQNPVHFYNIPGQYPVKLVVSTHACSDSAIKTNYIKVFRSPNTTITGNRMDYCGPSSITMQGNLLNPDSLAVAWKWDFGNGNNATLQQPPAQQYNDTGSYTIHLIALNTAGCSDTASTTIIIHPIPATYAGKDTAICSGNTASLLATGADNYTWLPNTSLSCSNCNNPVSFSQQDILYYVKGSNIFGCEKTDSIFIDVKQPFSISGLKNTDSICAGQSIQLNTGGAENYIWSPSQGLNNTTVNNPIANPAASTTYKVLGYDSSNCFKDSAIIFIQVNDLPTVNAGTDTMITSGSRLTITAQYSAGVTQWLWQPSAGLSCSTCPNPVSAPSGSTHYSITATNASGCTTTDSIFIRVNCNKNSVFLPTAFSPNLDEVNDVFYPLNAPGSGSITISSFTIYNRFGQIVFERNLFNSNDKTKGWDGKYNGHECPAGSYIYNISFSCNNIQLVKFSGNILLIR
jgi:gliding motility-associated-like protein